MDDSDLSTSNDYTLEQLRASLKSSTRDLVAAANSKMDGSGADESLDGSSARMQEKFNDNLDNSTKDVDSVNEIDYDTLDVTDEIKQLFQHIDAYEPIDLELDTPLKCFIPSYIPAIGQVDPMLKIPRPDGKYDGIGIARLDEVIESEQSNSAVVELQLRNWSKTIRSNDAVRSIKNAAANAHQIDVWIQSVQDIHDNEPQVHSENSDNATAKELLKPWPKELCNKLEGTSELDIPSPDIDLNLLEYSRVLCSLIGIPTDEGSVMKSVNMMFEMFLELRGVGQTNSSLP
jgi:intraflagellar transport protein 46